MVRMAVMSILFVLVFACQANAKQVLRMHQGNICPFQCIPIKTDNRLGLINEVTQLIFTEAGYEILLVNVPFVRAIQMLTRGRARGSIYDRSVLLNILGLMKASDAFDIAGQLHDGKRLYIGISVHPPLPPKT